MPKQKQITVKCGDANPNGNIKLTYKGGCEKELDITDAYRCVGCGGWFHFDCILEHFKLERGHDVARFALKQTIEFAINNYNYVGLVSPFMNKIIRLCKEGLKQTRPIKKVDTKTEVRKRDVGIKKITIFN